VSALAVRRLVLSDFRCYARLTLEVEPRPVVLSGANGAGKTNLLEAVSYLGPGRGLRGGRLSEVTRRGASGGWSVAARVTTPLGPVDIGTGLAPDREEGPERRVVKLDGETARGPAALADVVNTIWLTPQMDRLFVDGASQRRRFLDRLVYGFDGDHARRVNAYERAMRERARLLKTGAADAAWLAALEGTMAEHGVAIAAARRDAVARLRQGLAEGLDPFPAAEVGCGGTLETWLDEMPALAVEDRFRAGLDACRARDAESGGAAEGTHRSDLIVRHVAKDMPAAQCSTGEQKALLIAIVLANARLHAARRDQAPLLLLDEVAAHLDGGRREALFDTISALGAQVWLTGTERALFAGLEGRAQFLAVRDGTVSASADARTS
jgi:DNA replication and repair protein RecF